MERYENRLELGLQQSVAVKPARFKLADFDGRFSLRGRRTSFGCAHSFGESIAPDLRAEGRYQQSLGPRDSASLP